MLFIDTTTTEIYTLSLHDALPIYHVGVAGNGFQGFLHAFKLADGAAELFPCVGVRPRSQAGQFAGTGARSEEHTSELQSRPHLVCRLLLEKKKKNIKLNKCN